MAGDLSDIFSYISLSQFSNKSDILVVYLISGSPYCFPCFHGDH